jgi:SAM-dependent methyltransferase
MSTASVHWERVYDRKRPEEVSWYEPRPEHSLALIQSARLPRDASLLDVGGGASGLARELLAAGYTDISVADISSAALKRSAAALGDQADRVVWIETDLRNHRFTRQYDLWHDRALFHFMVEEADQGAYLQVLRAALRTGGHLILATFGPEGPNRCSGLPVSRYGTAGLLAAVGDGFELLSASLHEHPTPAGATQQFHYAHLIRVA